jgi:hypothetical protein
MWKLKTFSSGYKNNGIGEYETDREKVLNFLNEKKLQPEDFKITYDSVLNCYTVFYNE